MNTDSRYQLVDRYLDGLPNEKDGALLTEAIETDPDALAFLCESAEMEASLQKLLTPEPHAFAARRILPFWHWRRAGKWLTTGAAAAALITIVAAVLGPRGGPGGGILQQKSRVDVKRFAAGERGPVQLQSPGNLRDAGPMEKAEFSPGARWLADLKAAKISDRNDRERLEKGHAVTDDEYLVRYLKAAGVTFPGGASAHWLPPGLQSTIQAPPRFAAVNTAENLAWIARIEQDLEARGPRFINLNVMVWRFERGQSLPALLATERILSKAEVRAAEQLPLTNGLFDFKTSGSDTLRFNYTQKWPPGRLSGGPQTAMAVRREGNHILVHGLAGISPSGAAVEEHADMEFDLTLAPGEAAVLQLGNKFDGAEWIMWLDAALLPLPQMIILGELQLVKRFEGLSAKMNAYADAAEAHFRVGDFAAARNEFRMILESEPQNLYALCNLGVTQLRLGNTEEAAETLMRAEAYNYDLEFPHYARGIALLGLGRLDEAAGEMDEALRINGKVAPLWHMLGLIDIRRGLPEKAKKSFLKAVDIDPRCDEAHLNLAVIYSTGNPVELNEARKHYRAAISSGSARDPGLDRLLGTR